MYSVIIVGGGVAGLVAAAGAAAAGARVLLLERMEKPARKLRITGKGRCNITNLRPRDEFLAKVRSGADFMSYAFDQFDNNATVEMLKSIGLEVVAERGERLFPASGKAWDVAEVLIGHAARCGVEIRNNSRVKHLIINNNTVGGVVIYGTNGEDVEIPSRCVIMATGGVSYPATGSSGDGHQMAYDAGIEIEPLRPSLVPLEVDASGLKGLALKNVSLRLMIDGNVAEERFGDTEFTSEGVISGPIILQISRKAVDALIDERAVELVLDLKPALSVAKLEGRIAREYEALGGSTKLRILLGKLLPAPLHGRVAAQADLPVNTPLEKLTERDATRLIAALKGLVFKVYDYRPFTEAIVTAGGVALGEVDEQTMESRKIQGLFFAGELLDIDADTGGYNIQIAVSTGRLAGLSAAEHSKILDQKQ